MTDSIYTKSKCRTVVVAHRRSDSGQIVLRYLECHRRDCNYCQGKRVQKHVDSMTLPFPMQLYHLVADNTLVNTIIRYCRKHGEFYWRCPLKDGTSTIITTARDRFASVPIDDIKSVVRNCLDSQSNSKNVSSTRHAKPVKQKYTWETYYLSMIGMEDVKDYLTVSGWACKKNDLFIPRGDSVNWDTTLEYMALGGAEIKRPIKKTPMIKSVVFEHKILVPMPKYDTPPTA